MIILIDCHSPCHLMFKVFRFSQCFDYLIQCFSNHFASFLRITEETHLSFSDVILRKLPECLTKCQIKFSRSKKYSECFQVWMFYRLGANICLKKTNKWIYFLSTKRIKAHKCVSMVGSFFHSYDHNTYIDISY